MRSYNYVDFRKDNILINLLLQAGGEGSSERYSPSHKPTSETSRQSLQLFLTLRLAQHTSLNIRLDNIGDAGAGDSDALGTSDAGLNMSGQNSEFRGCVVNGELEHGGLFGAVLYHVCRWAARTMTDDIEQTRDEIECVLASLLMETTPLTLSFNRRTLEFLVPWLDRYFPNHVHLLRARMRQIDVLIQGSDDE